MLSMICVPFQLHNLGRVLKTEMESKTHSIKWKRLWLLLFIITIIIVSVTAVVVFFDTFALKRANTEEYLKNPKEIVVTTNLLYFCYEQIKNAFHFNLHARCNWLQSCVYAHWTNHFTLPFTTEAICLTRQRRRWQRLFTGKWTEIWKLEY